jgi:polar amino acid transport system substrate-binding protein
MADSTESRGPCRRRRTMLGLRSALAAALVAVGGALAFSAGSSARGAGGLDTLQPGVLTVAIEPYAPYTSYKNGKQVGLEADMLYAVAQKLHLKVKTVVTDFTGMLSGIQSHRYDITTGGIAWSAKRAAAGLFSDPLYYSPTEVAVTNGKVYGSIHDLEGASIGTVTGYVWVDGIKEIPHAKLHTYPNTQVIFDDLKAGRIDVAIIDPLLLADVQKTRPDLHMKLEYLSPPTDTQVKAHPAWTWFRQYEVAWYIPKQEPELEKAVSAQIDSMFRSGQEAGIIKKWGGSPAQFLKPGPWISKERRGVDRPATWLAPSIR